MNMDQWMNLCGMSGVSLYLSAWWWRMRWEVPKSLAAVNLVMRGMGLSLILAPLFLRWYLSSTALLGVSLLMAAYSTWRWWHSR